MPKSSKKRARAPDEDVADTLDSNPVKKSKLTSAGKAKTIKKSDKADPAGAEPASVGKLLKKKKERKIKQKKERKDKKEKKRKSKGLDAVAPESADEPAPPPIAEPASEPAPAAAAAANDESVTAGEKSKKKKKSKKDKQTKPAEQSASAEEPTLSEPPPTSGAGGKQTRFICFVGNLPFTATADAVRAHFASLHPTSVRLLTQRDDPSKSRGIAFVEFGRYDHMKTCLEKFHHTEFDDGVSPARRINVELTAGGGGKTPARQDKIKQKNAKLNEERAQRMKKEEQDKAKQGKEIEEKPAKTQEQRDEEAIHPSRRGRVPYGKR